MEQQLILQNPLLEQMKITDYTRYNTIYFDEEFDRKSCIFFCRQLKKLAEQELKKEKSKRQNIKVIISSYGGNVLDFYTCASLMEYYQEKGIIIETHCYGYAMSAGAKLLILGSKGHRYCTRYANILLHQIQTGQWGSMTMQEKLADVKQLERDWNTLKSIIKKHTKLTEEEIEGFTKNNLDVYYSPEEALNKGLVDIII